MPPEETAALLRQARAAHVACPPQPGKVRWDILERWLEVRDPEALEHVRQLTDPERCKKARSARSAAARAERAEARYEAQGVNLEDLAARGPAAIARAARGKSVWLYHGTSSALLPGVRKYGLRVGEAKVDPEETPGVYLTALPGRGALASGAAFYARRAAAMLGGDPVVLRVLVPFDELEPDMDDADIATGNWQWVTDYVAPEAILEIDHARVTPTSLKKPRARRQNPTSRDSYLLALSGEVLIRVEHVGDMYHVVMVSEGRRHTYQVPALAWQQRYSDANGVAVEPPRLMMAAAVQDLIETRVAGRDIPKTEFLWTNPDDPFPVVMTPNGHALTAFGEIAKAPS